VVGRLHLCGTSAKIWPLINRLVVVDPASLAKVRWVHWSSRMKVFVSKLVVELPNLIKTLPDTAPRIST
jgi:hypothetical protein